MIRSSLLVLLAMSACKTSSDGDDFPVSPGGPGAMGTMVDGPLPADAAVPDSGLLVGRVCLIRDLRGLACAATGVAGVTVTLGTRSAITGDSGTFTMTAPSGSNVVWRTSAAELVSSVMPFGTSTTIPAIAVQDYLDLRLANSVVQQVGQGAIVARLV